MQENQQRLMQAWVSKAENDLLNVQNNLQAQKVPWDTVCFHCQQAAEKYLERVAELMINKFNGLYGTQIDLVKHH